MVFLIGSLIILTGKQSSVVAEEDWKINCVEVEELTKMFGQSMEPSKGEVLSRYDPTPTPVNISKDQFDSMLQSVKNNLFFLGHHSRAHENVGIEFDGFLIPNGIFAEVKAEWVSVVNADGLNILREPTAEEKEWDARFGRQPGRDKLYLLDSETKPIYAEGKVQITVPIRFAHVVFDASDVGKSRQSPPLTATLLRLENDLVSLKIKGVPEKVRPVLVLRDETGDRLKVDSTTTRRSLQDNGPTLVCSRAFGRIAKVELFLPIEFASSTLTVQATSEPETFGDNAWQVKVPRYMPDPGMPDFVAMDLTTLKAETEVVAQRTYAMIGFNTPEISVRLPRVDNSAFAHVEFGEPELFCAEGNSIDYWLERGGYDHETFSAEIRFRAEEGGRPIFRVNGECKIIEFARAVGTVNIRYPARLKVVTLTTEHAESGDLEVQFHGPKVMIRGMDNLPFRPFLPYSLTALRAYDNTGCRLKKLNFSGNIIENNINWKLAGFWGEVKELRIVTVEEWIELEVPFDLPPAPELPESQRGRIVFLEQ